MSQLQQCISRARDDDGATPEDIRQLEREPNCAQYFLAELPRRLPPSAIREWNDQGLRLWETVAGYLKEAGRLHEALLLYGSLYDHLHSGQKVQQRRIHKGNALLWMTDCFDRLGYPSIAKRYLMLTLCEDAISYHEKYNTPIDPRTSGLYPRAIWLYGLSDAELNEHATRAVERFRGDTLMGRFPEWVLHGLGNDWMTVPPSAAESSYYILNKFYVETLANMIDRSGHTWEMLCNYVVSCIPGCATESNVRAEAGEYDIVCSMNGPDVDFRSELGRYFVCECKDKQDPSSFTEMAKFCRILDATKSRFGILFSREGMTGEDRRKEARLEQERVYWDRGIVVVCIDGDDIKDLAQGGNFIRLLRTRVEEIRLSRVRSRRSGEGS